MPWEEAHRHAALVSVANDDQIGSLEIAALAESVDDSLERCVEAGVGDMARAVYCNAYCGVDRFGPKTLVISPRETAIVVVDDQSLSHDSDLEQTPLAPDCLGCTYNSNV